MTFDTSAPDTPPDPGIAPAVSSGNRLRLRAGALLLNGRLLGVVLFLVVSGLVAQTLLIAPETPSRRVLSDLYMASYDALISTKSAYTPDLVFARPASATIAGRPFAPSAVSDSGARSSAKPSFKTPSSKTVSGSKSVSKVFKYPARTRGDQAVEKWRGTVRNKQARAAEWRRLGIVLALFQRPGALEALAHVGDQFPLPPAQPRPKRAAITGNSDVDPFGHGRVGINAGQELAAWQALYGAQTINATQVPGLRNTLKQLRLGWFENVALAQLYQKAGLHAEAASAAEAADGSARNVRELENVQINGIGLGCLLALCYGISAIARRLHQNRNRRDEQAARAFYAQTYAPAPSTAFHVNSAPLAEVEAGRVSRAPFPLSLLDAPPAMVASGLLVAFIVYLVGHTVFGLLLGYAMRPFAPRLDGLNYTQLLRVYSALRYALYLPIFLVPLYALRARIASAMQSSRPLTMRALLAHLGYRCRSLFAEAKAGTVAYLLLMPGLLLAGAASHFLFHRFHTPVNPAQFETMTALQLPDKIMIFVMAAVIAPIVEETMFRGLLYSALHERFGIMGAAMLSAAIFSLVHPTLPGGFLTIWAIGIALALVYEKRGSLLPGMILHGIHNGLITLLGFAVFGQ